MKIGEVARLKYEGRICCDHCNDYIFADFQCPSCKNGRIGNYEGVIEVEGISSCKNCKSTFKRVEESEDDYLEYQLWEKI